MKLDDFIIEHGVKIIDIFENNGHFVMRDIVVEFNDGNKFEIHCHKDNIENMLRKTIPKFSKLGLRRKKLDKITNRIK